MVPATFFPVKRRAPLRDGMQRNPSQYSLRTLLLAVTAAAVVFALARAIGGPDAVLGSLIAIVLAGVGTGLYMSGARAFGASFAAAALVELLAYLVSLLAREVTLLVCGLWFLGLALVYLASRVTTWRKLLTIAAGMALGYVLTLLPMTYLAARAERQWALEQLRQLSVQQEKLEASRTRQYPAYKLDRPAIASKPTTLDVTIRNGRWAYVGHGGSGLVIGERDTAFLRADHDKVEVDAGSGFTVYVKCVPKHWRFVTPDGVAAEGELGGVDLRSRLKQAKNLTVFAGDKAP